MKLQITVNVTEEDIATKVAGCSALTGCMFANALRRAIHEKIGEENVSDVGVGLTDAWAIVGKKGRPSDHVELHADLGWVIGEKIMCWCHGLKLHPFSTEVTFEG